MSKIIDEHWERVGYVAIEDSNGDMIEYRGLDFKFNVRSIAGIYQDFTVSILGLSATTINDLTVWDITKAIEKPRKIEVYGGYKRLGPQVVASGYIWYAVPTAPPEMWMNFECRQFIGYSEEIKNPYVLEGMKESEILKIIAAECGFRSDYRATKDEVVSKFSIEGNRGGLPEKFGKTCYKDITIDSGYIICRDKNGEREEPRQEFYISQDTGLLSIGQIDIMGARITTRLMTDIKIFDWIELESKLIPSSSGAYYVISEESEGHFRGDKWQTTFRCLRKV